MNYKNLDDTTRSFMLHEIDRDISLNNLYISPRLNSAGVERYADWLREAAQNHNDDWLAMTLATNRCMNLYEQRRRRRGGFTTAKMPHNAPNTLAEGEFNRFYIRGLCLRAKEEGIEEVEIYRAKQVQVARSVSHRLIGKRLPVDNLLEDLREAIGVDTALRLPPGPNSGLSACLPED